MASGLRVAIDLDGTIADMSAAMHAVAKKHFGLEDEPPADDALPDEVQERPALGDLGLSPRQLDALWSTVLRIKDFWTTLDEMETGIVRRISALAAERRWDVLFITTRPSAAGATTQVQSQSWLVEHGFERPSVYVVKGSRGRIADALTLDAVIDDRPENCLDVAIESSARAILVWPGAASDLPSEVARYGVTVVASIGAALDELVTIDRARTGGVVRSLKRLFNRP